MNRLLKHVSVIAVTLVLILGAAFVAAREDAAPAHFRIGNEQGQQNISIYDAGNGNFYVFLPSYADLEQVQTVLPNNRIYYLDDIRLTDQMTCAAFELERPYRYSIDGQDTGILWFYRSENVAAMYIDTVSGALTDIHADKDYEEYASMSLYLPDGTRTHFDASSRLKGRGNSSWDQDKRPYLLKLSSDGALLGMEPAKKWVLLANAYDETNLNNKLAFDLASRVGFSWSSDSRFVDLYLNGEYHGLYLLTEKIETHPSRLDLDTGSGDFLCKVDTWDRKDQLQYFLASGLGRAVEVCSEDVLSSEQLEQINVLVNRMEQEISSGGNLKDSRILDLDSWVRRYLIDEITGNIDSDLTSSYFYYEDGTFYAGPVWDYDMAFGNHYRNQEAFSFHAKNAYKRYNCPSPYYSALYANESFYQRMVEIYRMEFLPVLEAMMDREIDQQLQTIRSAARMNSIRWRNVYDDWREKMMDLEVVQEPEDLKNYLIRRVQFLNSAWLENKDYCTVQFEAEPGDAYWSISVERGLCLQTTYMDLVDTVWVDALTGETVDFGQPITRDMIVKPESAEEPGEATPAQEAAVPSETEKAEWGKPFLLFGCLLSVLLVLLVTDLSRKQKQ